jgi:hypothetical protein
MSLSLQINWVCIFIRLGFLWYPFIYLFVSGCFWHGDQCHLTRGKERNEIRNKSMAELSWGKIPVRTPSIFRAKDIPWWSFGSVNGGKWKRRILSFEGSWTLSLSIPWTIVGLSPRNRFYNLLWVSLCLEGWNVISESQSLWRNISRRHRGLYEGFCWRTRHHATTLS